MKNCSMTRLANIVREYRNASTYTAVMVTLILILEISERF